MPMSERSLALCLSSLSAEMQTESLLHRCTGAQKGFDLTRLDQKQAMFFGGHSFISCHYLLEVQVNVNERTHPPVEVLPQTVYRRSHKDKASHKNGSKGCMKVGVCTPHPSQKGPEGIKRSKHSPCSGRVITLAILQQAPNTRLLNCMHMSCWGHTVIAWPSRT